MWKIKANLLLDAINSAQRYMPDEFMCLLCGDKKRREINEIALIPTHNSEESVLINEGNIPIDPSILGTLHSHPFSTNNPSEEDKKLFARYEVNIILGHPFSIQNTGFYDSKGKRIECKLI